METLRKSRPGHGVEHRYYYIPNAFQLSCILSNTSIMITELPLTNIDPRGILCPDCFSSYASSKRRFKIQSYPMRTPTTFRISPRICTKIRFPKYYLLVQFKRGNGGSLQF